MKRTIINMTIVVILAGLSIVWPVAASNRQDRNAERMSVAETQESQGRPLELREESLIPRSRHCTLGAINGRYALTATGTIVQPIPQLGVPAGPYALTGVFNFNSGQFTGSSVQSFNGLIAPPNSVTGTYNVNDDCTGTGIDNFGTSFYFVIADDGKEVRFIFTTPGTAITGNAKKL